MKSLKKIPLDQHKHFAKCKCGQYFDMRDLSDVLSHEHQNNQSVTFSLGKRMGEAVQYSKNKKRLTFN